MADSREPPRLVTPLNWLAVAAVALLLFGVILWSFLGTIPRMVDGRGVILRDSGSGVIRVEATRHGVVSRVWVKEGDLVEPGQPVATLQTLSGDGGEDSIRSIRAGRVIEVIASAGNVLKPGSVIARMESADADHEVLLYVSALEGKRVRNGMEARITPTAAGLSEGSLRARVTYVSPHPVTQEYLNSELGGNQRLADWLMDRRASTEVVLELIRDPSRSDGYARWGRSSSVRVESGLLVNGRVIFARVRPILWLLSAHRD